MRISICLGTAQEIESAVGDFRRTLSTYPYLTPIKEVKQAARQLDILITEPIRQHLGNTRNILISPDSQLNLVPFEALVDENNQYLVENYSFTYLTSGRDLLRLQNQSPSQQQPVIMGDPNFNKPGEAIALETNTRTFIVNLIKVETDKK
ncbi:MAG: CHAT domain-containing protein [Spirulinaceae cyanobacterium]